MITDIQSGTRIDEIASGIYRIHIPMRIDAIPGGFSFNHFLILDDQALLFHTGYRKTFPLVRQAIAAVIPPERLRYVGYSHYEPDESGAVDSFLDIAPEADVCCSEIGAMTAQGDAFAKPALALAQGQVLSLGAHQLQWIATPHLPHGWDCGILFDQTTGTLLCGDLFTQGGADVPPVTESEILSASEGFRRPMDYFAHAANSQAELLKLAALQPKLLACQHGSSYRGDGGALLRELGDILAREQQMALAAI